MYPFYDWTMLLILPALLLSFWAQHKVSSAFARWSQVRTRANLTGAQVAQRLLLTAGLPGVTVERTQGQLDDHYDPRAQVLRLSPGVAGVPSVAAAGIAAHEIGHAVQHREAFVLFAARSAIVPVANIGSQAAMPLFLLGLLFGSGFMMNLGIIAFSTAVAFQLVTLPVELDASRRALALLRGSNILAADELPGARAVLTAAAFTYLAATLMAVLQLLRLIVLRGSHDD
ncbi:MAG TPA: zinc metallopeptidase [bacterium]|nr:zinc metallopeptidase [bacterium]